MSTFNCTIDGCFPMSGLCPPEGGLCKCYIEYKGDGCELSIRDVMPNVLLGYQITFGILFPLVSIAALIVLVRLPKKLHIHYGIFSLLIFFGFVRTIYLVVDPHGAHRISRIAENVLYGLGVWALLSVLLFIVALWIYIVHISKYRTGMNKLLKVVYILIIVFFFVHLLFDLLRVYFNFGGARLAILGSYFLVVAIFVMVPATLYLIYGRRLYNEIKETSKTTNKSSKHLKKVTFLTTSVSALCLSLILLFIIIMGIASINDTVELYMGIHFTYRILEFSYCCTVLAVFHKEFKKKDYGSTALSQITANDDTKIKNVPIKSN